MTLQNIDDVNIAGLPVPQVKGYGLLYNSYAFRHADFAPDNWIVPTLTDLQTLMSNVTPVGNLMSTRSYPTYVTGWCPSAGTDSSNFSLLPAGLRISVGSIYASMHAFIASTTPYYLSDVYRLQVSNSPYNISYSPLFFGLSVRLLMVNTSGWTVGDTLTDLDGNIYDTIKIGSQVWIASNWKCTKLNDIDNTPIPNVTDNATWNAAVTPAYCSYNNLPLIEE